MKMSILVVDDSSSDLELLLVVLRSTCPLLDIYVAHDGQEALDFLLPVAEAPPHPSRTLALVLLDIKMPKVDGLEVLSVLKSDLRTRTTPVIMFTSSSEEKDVETAYQIGANGYVVKPVDFQEYQDLLGGIVAYWLNANRLPGADMAKPSALLDNANAPGVTIYECSDSLRRGTGRTQ